MIGLGIWERRVLIGLPFVWLAVFFLAAARSRRLDQFCREHRCDPALSPLLSLTPAGGRTRPPANYRELAEGCLRVYATSLGNAGLATLVCLLIGYPVAFAIARAPGVWRHLLLFLVILPFWTSFLIRVYAWIALLQPSGLINRLLLAAGLVEAPVRLLYNGFFGRVGLVYSYLPFMILPLYGSLSRLDETSSKPLPISVPRHGGSFSA